MLLLHEVIGQDEAMPSFHHTDFVRNIGIPRSVGRLVVATPEQLFLAVMSKDKVAACVSSWQTHDQRAKHSRHFLCACSLVSQM